MQVQAFAASDVGQKRENNEDCFLIDEPLQAYLVCDGMGGHAAGDVAARKAIEFAIAHLAGHRAIIEQAAKSPEGCYRVLELAEEAVQSASQELYQLAKRDRSLAGMGTTLTMLIVVDDKAIMSHVGDSRLYLFRDGEAHLLSTDHTLENELRQLGAKSEQVDAGRFSHMLTRAIGTQEAVEVESLMFDLLPGDRCLLCSDGLSNYFADAAELRQVLGSGAVGEDTAARLIKVANERGGRDNITALVLEVAGGKKHSQEATRRLRERMQALGKSFLFEGLGLSRLMRIANHTDEKEWKPGQAVVLQGRPLEGMLLVVSGKLAVDGDDRVVTCGQTIGATALQVAHDAPRTVAALEPARTLLITRKAFQLLTRRRPKLGRRLFQRLTEFLSKEVVRLATQTTDLASTTDTWVR